MLARLGRSAIGGLGPASASGQRAGGPSPRVRISTDFVPQEDTWQAEGTHHVREAGHLGHPLHGGRAAARSDIGQLRSSRTESQTRVFSPATPVDSAGNPVIASAAEHGRLRRCGRLRCAPPPALRSPRNNCR